jgi:T5SS/PEP-CTERM-associated repeat protein
MRRFATRLCSFALLGVLFLAGPLSPARATITATSGTASVSPVNPSTWTSSTTGYIGYTASGTVTVDGGSDLLSLYGYIGYNAGASGRVTVDGAGSTWVNGRDLYVGSSGSATLNISNGGSVSAGRTTYVYGAGSTGTINFGPGGGTLTTMSLQAAATALTGTGTINTKGLVSDVSLTFDGTGVGAGTFGTMGTVTVDMSATTGNGDLGVGYVGTSTVMVQNGAKVYSGHGYIGYNAGSAGTVAVSGAGATWTNSSSLYVGSSGSGTLCISNGGSISNGGTSVGYNAGSVGAMIVDGVGSVVTNVGSTDVGWSGTGTLSIVNGGSVIDGNEGSIGYQSGSAGTVTVDGAGSTWTCNHGGSFQIGYGGTGTLNVLGGGAVLFPAGNVWVADQPGSAGAIHFGPGGGTVTTRILHVSPSQLTGTGTISTKGLITDADLTFDSTHGARQTIPINGGSITMNIDLSNPSDGANFGLGYRGNGSAVIRDGITVNSGSGFLGYNAGSSGAVTVDGAGSTWSTTYGFLVGYNGKGTLIASNGGRIGSSSCRGYIGELAGSEGTVTVDGAGSKWLCDGGELLVGNSGNGILNITNGGYVESTHYANKFSVACGTNSKGTVRVDGAGSMLFVPARYFTIGAGGQANLSITNGGTVSSPDADLAGGSSSSCIVTVEGVGSKWTDNGHLAVGEGGTAVMNISGGGSVGNSFGYIGYYPGSLGKVGVTGPGSMWTSSYALYVGYHGTGTLNVTNGGTVSNSNGCLGCFSGSPGAVRVDGGGSRWTNGGYLLVGGSGSGTVSISGGGAVTTTGSVSINSSSLLAIDVGGGSSLGVSGSAGTITNSGKIRFLAGAGVAAGSIWSPISAGTWGGTGTYQAVGGTWSGSTHQFTVSDVQSGMAGGSVTIDLGQKQRILVSGGPSGWALGGSFLMKTSPSPLTFTATPISDGPLAGLGGLLDPGDGVLGGWTLSATGSYAAGDPAYLSFGVGGGESLGDLSVWQYANGTWAKYDAFDLTYDQTYASFTVTGMGTYAVAGLAVPEPAAVALLAVGAVGLGWWARRRR